MPPYVTKEHFNATMDQFRRDFFSSHEFQSTINNLPNDLMTKMDGTSVILQRLDQERVLTIEWIRRIEGDLSMVKQRLKIA